jgi:starch phosphorylase
MTKGNTPEQDLTNVEDVRTGTSVTTIRRALANHLLYTQGRFPEVATKHDIFMAAAYTIRDRLVHRWINSVETFLNKQARVVCYLSAEFLMGPQLANNLVAMDLYDTMKEAVHQSGLELRDVIEQEEEPGLGNGGLGRLAACYLDSLATLDIPAIGYGIRYEYGIFDQEIHDGWQVEITDKWLKLGNPWEIARPEQTVPVKLGGYTQGYKDEQGRYRVVWHADSILNGVPHDTPVPGYKTNTANTLRLWKAEAQESFNFQQFNAGDYSGAVHDKVVSENLTKVLYPNDNISAGKELRLKQQYFFVSCSLQDAIRMHLQAGGNIKNLHEKYAFQMNDTHPSIAVAELMRLLVDEHNLTWEQAWHITTRSLAYTNHTLLPEALERWPVDLIKNILPRHMEIILEINRRFLDFIKTKYPQNPGLLERVSIIDESGSRYVRMANLACVGSYAINGVAALHTELLQKEVLKDFYMIWPEKFSNKTNGVTPRRFMAVSNPEMTKLITTKVGPNWLMELKELKALEAFAQDSAFQDEWALIKRNRKIKLASYLERHCGAKVDPDSIFDVHAKRLHEYKRQHLNVLNIVHLYNQLKNNPGMTITPRTFLFAGKAAPGYYMAKLIIKLITSVGAMIDNDPAISQQMKVVFIPDFNVRLGQVLYPAANLSEQISTAGKEASGTGNMKFALNGALTVGTLDGANIEMLDYIGKENFFLFGLTAQEVTAMKSEGYNPRQIYNTNDDLKAVIDLISSGHFSYGDTELFKPIVDSLLDRDEFMLLADFADYVRAQKEAGDNYLDQRDWTRKSILNVARMGNFSSDRSIQEYCDDIWHVKPVKVSLDHYLPANAILQF